MGAADRRDNPVGKRREGRQGIPGGPGIQAHRGDGCCQGIRDC